MLIGEMRETCGRDTLSFLSGRLWEVHPVHVQLTRRGHLFQNRNQMTRQHALKAKGIDLNHPQREVTLLLNMHPEDLAGSAKTRKVTRARNLFCYLAVRIWVLDGRDILNA
jgi:hypothetical protein